MRTSARESIRMLWRGCHHADRRFRLSLRSLVAAACLTLFPTAWLAVPAWAQDRFFDVDPLTAPIDGGSANWSDTDWKTTLDGTAGVAWATNNTAIFAPIVGSPDATTITLSGTQTATAVTFNGAGYTLTGGTLALAGTGGSNWINVNANATIQSALTHLRFKGTGEVTISGGGTSTARGIIGDGTSGLVTVRQTGGTFTIAGNQWLMVGGDNVANSQGAYIMDAGSLTIAQGIYLGWGGAGRTGSFTQNGGTVTTQNGQGIQIGIGGGTGAYTLNGGTLISSFGDGGAPYSGSFTFGGGTLQANFSFNTNRQVGVTTSIANGATARINTNGQTVTWSTALTGAAAAGLTKTGTGTLQLTANNTYTGTTTVSGGTLQIGSGTAGSVAGAIVNDASLVFDRSSNLTHSGSISGSGSLTKQGAGVLTLSGTNTYAGVTTISAGAIAINAVTALPGWNVPGRVSVASGGELRVGLGVSNADLQTIAATTAFASGGALGIDTGAGSRTVSESLSGNYGITKIGGNTLVLSGANTYVGNTLAAAGTVQAGSGTAFGFGTVSTSGSGGSSGAINLNGFSFSNPFAIGFQSAGPGAVGALLNTNTASTSVLNGNVAIGGENYVGGNGSVTLEGVVSGGVSGNYSLYKQGTGVWRFANPANTFNGFYYQIGGTTEVTKLANLNEASSLGQPTTTTANRFSFGIGGSGGGTLRFAGADASTSDRVFLLQGATDAASNRIDADGTSAAATLTLTGGLSATRSGAYTVALGGTNAGVNTYSGVIANGSGTVGLLKDGGTTWSLAGANTFTGGATVAAGRLVLDYSTQNNSKLADAAAVALGTSGGPAVVLELAGGSHIEVVASTTLAAPATISRASGTSVIQLGAITRSGSQATLTLGESGVATTNTRNTNGILGGWATVGGTDWAANATDADNGSIVAYTGYTDVDAQGGSITSAATSNVRINAPGSSGPITLAAGTTDINTLLQATATAATIDTAGKSLRLGAAGGILVPAGSASVTIGSAAGDGTLTAGGAADTAGGLTVTTQTGTAATVNAAITNNGTGIVSLAKSGPGTLTLAGASTFTGGTVVTGGTLALSGGTNRLPAGGTVTLNGGSLDTDANAQSVAGLTVAGDGGTVTGTGIFTNSGTYSLAGNAGLNVANPLAGNLYAVGPGTLTISGGLSSTSNRIVAGGGASLVQAAGDVTTTNFMMVGRNNGADGPATSGSATYTISSGSLTVGQGIYLGWTGGNTGRFIQNGGRVETQQNGQGIHIGIDGGSGTYELNAGTLVTTFASNVSNGGSFTFGGGTLQARGPFAMNQPNVATSIAAGAVAQIDTNGTTVTWTNTLSGPAAAGLTKSGAGTLVLAANNTYAGTTTVSSGTLQIGSGTAGSVAGAIVNDASLVFDRSNDLTQSGVISGSGSLTKRGAGTLTLSGANTYTGGTTLAAGTLLINGNNAGAAGAVSVATGATLGGSGTVGGATTVSGTHSPGTSPGLQTFTNGLSYASTATLVWELSANTALSADRGTLYDGINLTTAGALAIDPAASLSLVFNQPLADSTPSTVAWTDAFWGSDRQWVIADLSSPVTWDGAVFSSLSVGADSLGAALTAIRPNASFSLANSGGDLVLNYVAVPEPGTWALVAAAAAGMLGLRCRRRVRETC